MRLVRLLVAAMSSFSPSQAAAPAPVPPALVAPAPPVKKPSHSFVTPFGKVEVDDDVCDVLDTDDGPWYVYVSPDGSEFSVSSLNCAEAVKRWMLGGPSKKLPRA